MERHDRQQNPTDDEREIEPRTGRNQPPMKATDKCDDRDNAHREEQDRGTVIGTSPDGKSADGKGGSKIGKDDDKGGKGGVKKGFAAARSDPAADRAFGRRQGVPSRTAT